MENQLETYPSVTSEIVDNASLFTDFLSSDTVEPIRETITIIPNIVKDILDVALENKRLKIKDSQFRRKAELAQHYLEFQDKNAQRKYHIELENIHTQADTVIAEIEQKRDVELAHIESTKRTQLQKIESDERIELKKIQSQYEFLNFQPKVALNASWSGNLHVHSPLDLLFSHPDVIFFHVFNCRL